jgi:hypothetical protein
MLLFVFETQLRSSERLTIDLCEKGLNLLLSLSVFFILGRFLISGINFNFSPTP